MSKRNDDPEYEVGYGRPPKKNRFKKGESGNPKGRPKTARGLGASVTRELQAKIIAREGDRTVTISKGEAAAKRLVEKALKGDMAAFKVLLQLDGAAHGKPAVDAGTEALAVIPDGVDMDILRHYFTSIEPTDTGPRDEGGADVDDDT